MSHQQDKGTKVLKSGNLLLWSHVVVGDRGGLSAGFTSAPTEEDVAEAKQFLDSQIPPGARRAVESTGSYQECSQKLVDHLQRNARNI